MMIICIIYIVCIILKYLLINNQFKIVLSVYFVVISNLEITDGEITLEIFEFIFKTC